MKTKLIALGLSLALLTPAAGAARLPELTVDGAAVAAVAALENGTTYVSLRAVSQAILPDAVIGWRDGRASVRAPGVELTAVPGENWLEVNGRCLYVAGGVRLEGGSVLVPVRVLADALGAEAHWEAEAGRVVLATGGRAPRADYDEQDLYWLSRIISAESRGESLEGQIAVGNVVLNRVKSREFPDTVYGVIFDGRWGGQFEPVRNGTIYDAPTAQSVAAAKLCLEGTVTAGKSLYFLDPSKAGNLWTVKNRPYVTTIGVHAFYA